MVSPSTTHRSIVPCRLESRIFDRAPRGGRRPSLTPIDRHGTIMYAVVEGEGLGVFCLPLRFPSTPPERGSSARHRYP